MATHVEIDEDGDSVVLFMQRLEKYVNNNIDMMEATRIAMQMTDDEVAEAESMKRWNLCVSYGKLHRDHDHITGQFLQIHVLSIICDVGNLSCI